MSYFQFNGKGINQIFTGVSASHTGDTLETILCSVQIPANRYRFGDFLTIDSMFLKTGSGVIPTGSATIRFYWVAGTTATLTGAILLSIRSVGSGSFFISLNRRLHIRTADGTGSSYSLGTELASTTSGIFSDYAATTVSNVAIDWTVDGVIFATVDHNNSSNNITQYYIKIWEIPSFGSKVM